jgi:glyoxylase-like metal-dependent hydrolase (beta-lactamase superfamily II)
MKIALFGILLVMCGFALQEKGELIFESFDGQCNVYLFACPETKDAAVIDPSGATSEILEFAQDKDLNIKHIFVTHSHWDHISALRRLSRKTGATIYCHRAAKSAVRRAAGRKAKIECVKKGEIKVGNLSVKIIATPGHSRDCLSFLVKDRLFTGDAVNIGGICPAGRSVARRVVKRKFKKLDDKTRVYMGHSEEMTLGELREELDLK